MTTKIESQNFLLKAKKLKEQQKVLLQQNIDKENEENEENES